MSDQKTSRRLLGWLLVPLLLVVAAGAWLSLDPAFQLRRSAPDVSAALPTDEFERRVRNYILDNPDVIMEAARRFEQSQRAAEEGEATAVLKTRSEEILRDRDSPVSGNPNGDVSLVEFFDYNCPYCRQVTPIMAEAETADPKLPSSTRNSRSWGRIRPSPPRRRSRSIGRASTSPSTRR